MRQKGLQAVPYWSVCRMSTVNVHRLGFSAAF